MKKLLSFLIIILSVFSSKASAVQNLPIQSQDALREYALSKVVRGYRSVSAVSMIRIQNQPTWVDVRGVGAEDVLNKLFNTEITYSLSNPKDKVTGMIWLYDASDTLIFFGNSEYLITDLGKNGPVYSIWMQSIPLLQNVQFAQVLALDEDGVTTRTYNVPVDSVGRILFDPWMSGAPNGILSVRFKDNAVVNYNLWNPTAESPGITTEANYTWNIEGHHVYPLSPKDVALVNIVEAWTLPTVFIEVGAKQSIKLDVLGMVQINQKNIFERPISFTFTQVDGPWAGAGKMYSDQPTLTVFPAAGKYRIRFEWDNFGKPNNLYTGPISGDGGKG